ncbi:hypothetical protein ACFQ8O_33890 [Streptomyces coelicoflavus]|uniref:hypothetical protein n=1 Tax=Streptomyces coelicoflavus TaxID=285562 RepID=UPI0036CEB599
MNPSARSRTAATALSPHPPGGRPGRSARRALPVLLAALLPLTACGIPETGVVEAGEPATGVLRPGVTAAPSETVPEAVPLVEVPLYFVADGDLTAVTRTVAGSTDLGSTVLMLFKGPDPQERRRGLTTELPSAAVAPTIRTDGTVVNVQLPRTAGSLSDTAIDQLACTVAVARLRQDPALGSAQVAVEQPGGRLAGRSSDDCPSGGPGGTGGAGGAEGTGGADAP